MLRRFTRDIGRFKEGELHDYPRGTWNNIASRAKVSLDSFTDEAEINQLLQSKTRGTLHIKTRLGSTARPAH